MIFKLLSICSLVWSLNMIAASQEFIVGYFPTTMPRDPIDIDIYLEHIAVGQVIETLVRIDHDGNLVPNLAKSWKINEEGKVFSFIINENIEFSNGKILDCQDIFYSITRHMESKSSQSKDYLKNIEEIICKGKHEIEFRLKNAQVSFLKILSRDHLGILPKGWVFDVKSKEPWVGTGPYRFMQEEGTSLFLKNSKYRKANDIKIERWFAIKSDDVKSDFSKLKIPDLILHIPSHVKQNMESSHLFNNIKYERPMHFIQTSVWWYPLGANFNNTKYQENVMSIIDEFILKLNELNKFELATGIVPKGIQGHNTKRLPSSHAPEAFHETKTIKVTVYANDYEAFFGSDIYKSFENKYNFKFQITKYNFSENDPKIIRPDILIASYAGGFSDPDGFLVVLGSLLGLEPSVYLSDVEQVYKDASKEQDWTLRGDKFRKINEFLITSSKVVPAWKRDLYIGKSTRLVDDSSAFSYSLRFERFKAK